MIDAAAVLHIKTILVIPGIVNELVSFEDAYMRALDALRELSTYAEAANVEIKLEMLGVNFY